VLPAREQLGAGTRWRIRRRLAASPRTTRLGDLTALTPRELRSILLPDPDAAGTDAPGWMRGATAGVLVASGGGRAGAHRGAASPAATAALERAFLRLSGGSVVRYSLDGGSNGSLDAAEGGKRPRRASAGACDGALSALPPRAVAAGHAVLILDEACSPPAPPGGPSSPGRRSSVAPQHVHAAIRSGPTPMADRSAAGSVRAVVRAGWARARPVETLAAAARVASRARARASAPPRIPRFTPGCGCCRAPTRSA
jgi:hypothetical protein